MNDALTILAKLEKQFPRLDPNAGPRFCRNDNYRDGSLAAAIIRQVRAIAGRESRKPISEQAWALAIADQLEAKFGVGCSQVLSVLGELLCSPSDLMARADAEELLNEIGELILAHNKRGSTIH